MQDGFIKVAAGTPKVKVADCQHNAEQIIELMTQAQAQGVQVLTLPELCITGYTCADLFLQDTLLHGAIDALGTILMASQGSDMVVAVGIPLHYQYKLYNCGVILQDGRILGAVPKQHLPNYAEFQEVRWFQSGTGLSDEISLCGQTVPLGTDLLFACEGISGLTVGVEVCEDAWVVNPPSVALVQGGASLIMNLSASNELVGKAQYRRMMIASLSARLVCGYVYSSAGEGESSTDLVFSAHNLVCENGSVLAERRLAIGLTVSELDVSRLTYERQRMNTFPAVSGAFRRVTFRLEKKTTTLTRTFPSAPFVPSDMGDRVARCEEILNIAALGLKKRLEHTHAKTAIVGLSGGLDSTLAILIADIAMKMLGRPSSDIVAVTMPCFGTTDRTRDNAVELADRMGATFHRIDIGNAVQQHFLDIGQSMDCLDVTFENGQARERTQVLMDLANKLGGLVIGTGDLSELALGWATYNGDHMSMYAVNASIPKTLVRHLVAYVADESTDARMSTVLRDILDTPVSPELLPAVDGKISQRTEDLVGPYELHDFFLYYMVRCGFAPQKILRLAVLALGDRYSEEILLKWLKNFYRRFFSQQFKRSCLPDGPKVGSVTFSPRGDWRMPSDAVAALWTAELEKLG